MSPKKSTKRRISRKGSLDDFPRRPEQHVLAADAEHVFTSAIQLGGMFMFRLTHKDDYGIDGEAEAVLPGGSIPGATFSIQLKGTGTSLNSDGSVSIAVQRENLNYLAMHRDSVYACFHSPTRTIFVRDSLEIVAEYERKNPSWRNQRSVTIRFSEKLTSQKLRAWRDRVFALARSERDLRIQWSSLQPEEMLSKARASKAHAVHVPNDIRRAARLLETLYEAGEDRTISDLFAVFDAAFSEGAPSVYESAKGTLYRAEINLGLAGGGFERERVRDAQAFFAARIESQRGADPATDRYLPGNAILVLREDLERAIRAFRDAVNHATEAQNEVAAMALVNAGSAYSKLGRDREEGESYEAAIRLHPVLPEARYACGLWNAQHQRWQLAAEHFERLDDVSGSNIDRITMLGWRAKSLFAAGRPIRAYADVRQLISRASERPWIWGWCASLVSEFGNVSVEACADFWRRFHDAHPANQEAIRFRLRAEGALERHRKSGGEAHLVSLPFDGALGLLAHLDDARLDDAHLFDLVGHWARSEQRMQDAESLFRTAARMDPDYGVCHGMLLNDVGRYSEALEVLTASTRLKDRDASLWHEIAVASANSSDHNKAAAAYRKAIKLDPEYAPSWFELGGTYMNLGRPEKALLTWSQAIARFPGHQLAAQIADEKWIEKASLLAVWKRRSGLVAPRATRGVAPRATRGADVKPRRKRSGA